MTVGMSLLASLAFSLLGRLVFLAFLGLVLEDEGGQLVARIDSSALTTSLAVEVDVAVFDLDDGLGVFAGSAEDELVDEAIQVILELVGVVGTVDDPTVIRRVDVGLGTEFEAEILDEI